MTTPPNHQLSNQTLTRPQVCVSASARAPDRWWNAGTAQRLVWPVNVDCLTARKWPCSTSH
jgi:hypothetical protein